MTELSEEERRIRDEAIAYARARRTRIAKELTSIDKCPPENCPVSLFMAGSPGAGKTEFARALLRAVEDSGSSVIHIDIDELRSCFPAYTGGNAYLFQPAANLLLERIHDRALKQKQSFILDGTLAKYEIARKNIARSIRKERAIKILYVYQDPAQAWSFVQAREAVEGRRVQPELFVEQYFGARAVVNRLKSEYGERISVDLLVKDLDGKAQFYKDNIECIDNHLRESYDHATVYAITKSTLR